MAIKGNFNFKCTNFAEYIFNIIITEKLNIFLIINTKYTLNWRKIESQFYKCLTNLYIKNKRVDVLSIFNHKIPYNRGVVELLSNLNAPIRSCWYLLPALRYQMTVGHNIAHNIVRTMFYTSFHMTGPYLVFIYGRPVLIRSQIPDTATELRDTRSPTVQ